jgi:hypothetical protein
MSVLTLGGPMGSVAGSGENALFGVPFCGQVDDPGVARDQPMFVDYSRQPVSTPDQQRIEFVLDRLDLRSAALLHVGIGNSLLARRFSPRCRLIDGITVSDPERQHALSLGLANYRPFLTSKYGTGLPAVVPGPYDAIIDNNLASFACCGFHLMVMFSNYRLLLRSGGCILTDALGMAWSAGDPRWRIDFPQLEFAARRLSMSMAQITAEVFALIKP